MLDLMRSLLDNFLDLLMDVLPLSPFQSAIDALEQLPYLGYLNYFVPVGTFLQISAAWLSAITLFYLYSILMRWIRMIG